MWRPDGDINERMLQSKLQPLDVTDISSKSPNITYLTLNYQKNKFQQKAGVTHFCLTSGNCSYNPFV